MNLRPLRVYIAGPYTASTQQAAERNVQAAIDAGLDVWKKGHFPYVPHLTHFIDIRARERALAMTYEEYLRWDAEWLRGCDAVLYLGSSKGADYELGIARQLGLEIFFSVGEIPNRDTNEERPE